MSRGDVPGFSWSGLASVASQMLVSNSRSAARFQALTAQRLHLDRCCKGALSHSRHYTCETQA